MAELLARMRAVLSARWHGSTSAQQRRGDARPGHQRGLCQWWPLVQLSNREFSLLQACWFGRVPSLAQRTGGSHLWLGEEVESNAVEYLIHAAAQARWRGHQERQGVGWMVSKDA
jgi:hypothetical protein